MNYQLIYDNIITKARNEIRVKTYESYYEIHHIIPKCLGGNNTKENLVLLTAREHFLVHWLLIRIYPQNRKLAHAFWAMCNLKGKSLDNRIITSSHSYAEAKEHRSMLGMSDEQKQKLRKPKRDTSKMGKHDKHGIKNPFYGKTHSEEAKQKMKAAIKANRKDGWLPGNARKICIDEQLFNSLKESCVSIGLSSTAMINRLKSDKYPTWFYIENYQSHPAIKAPLSN
jgi:hypothetical protein